MDTLEKLITYRDTYKIPEKSEIKLKILQDYFNKFIYPYKFVYICDYDLTIEFIFEKHEFCHLLLGTIEKGFPDAKKYKGMEGYNQIFLEKITTKNLPSKLWDYAKTRIKYFHFLEDILNEPEVIFFNPNIVDRGNYKIATTRIKAEFLFYKRISNTNVLFFLLKERYLKPFSFFSDKTENYIQNQIKLTLVSKKKISRF